ncbi:MAG: LamG-like jellyroll fold domain-containing protein, partial [Lysobacter sp.]
MNFRDVTTVNFQGLVVAFARGDTPIPDPGEGLIATNLYFNVLALDVDSSSDAMDWTGFKPLTLPDAVRPVGMNMVNVPISYSRARSIDGLEDADQPFRVATNQEYVYLFRQAKKGTLLVNRLRLTRETAANNPQEVGFALDPAWEVRFQRSAKPDVPADERDSQSYLSPDRTPFLEPAFELFMIDGLVDGNFDIELLPRNEGTLLTCVVLVSRAAQKRVDAYELPLDAAGLFSLADKRYVGDRIPPDFAYSLVDGAGKVLAIDGRPSSAFYLKQERVRGTDNRSFTVKRSGRLMIAHRASLNDGPATLATVDLAVAADGHLARPAEQLRVDPVGVANYTLDFDPSSYVALPSWAPKQQYSVDLWIYPQSASQASQQILGPIDDHDAPYLRLVDGNAIEVGFQGKNGKPMSARTPAGSVRQDAWTRVQVSFDAKSDPKYRVRLNGFDTSSIVQGDGDHPSLGQINAISAPVDGFIGHIDQFLAYDGAEWDPPTLVGKFAFDTVDYIDGQQQPLNPPLTPNSHDPSMPAKVYGAHLVPSTSPAVVSTGALSWDDRGLTIYASYFDKFSEYSELSSSPFLLSGSDGLLHCYFKGASDAFSVMQLDTEIARSTFEAAWNTAAGTAESGRLQLVAAQPGAFMNTAKIGITPASTLGERFCNLRLESPSGVVETWNGVPRSQRTLAAVLAGDTVADPADARVRTGARGYFDFTGTRSAAYLPLANNPNQAEIAVVSRAAARMPLASIGIEDAGSDSAVVTLAFAPPRWPGAKVTARWPALPRRVGGFLDTLNGLASGYDYRAAGAIDTVSYSLSARSDLVAANRVVLFIKPGTDPLQRIAVSPVQDDALLCDVEIQAGPLSAQWRNVPRAQVAFATVLEGTADKKQYDYAKFASGDYAAIGASLIVITDGSDASVQDVSLGGQTPVPADDDLRISASLIAAFATAAYAAETLAPLSAGTAASCFQSAIDNSKRVIAAGSSLFRAIPFDVPTQGSVGVVADTGKLTDGIAPLSLQGFNGGWLNQPEQRTLGYTPSNWVGFEVDETKAPGIGALTIAGDMSLELWCRPERAAADELQPFQRLLTFSRQPPEGGDPVRYMAALNDCPSLKTAANTRVFTSFNSDRGTFYTWFSALGDAGTKAPPGIIGSIATIGVVQALLPVRIDQDGRLNVSFALDATQSPIVSKQGIVAGDWHQVAV